MAEASSSESKDLSAFEELWEVYGEELELSWKAIARRCKRDDSMILKASADDACFLPIADKHEYSLDVSPDGYHRLRFLKSHEPAKMQSYKRDGKPAVRKVFPRGAVYVHHLAYVVGKAKGDARIERRATFRGADGTLTTDVWMTISHLCGRNECVNPDHLVLEPHVVNLSRNACSGEVCAHKVKCIKTATGLQAKVIALESKFMDKM